VNGAARLRAALDARIVGQAEAKTALVLGLLARQSVCLQGPPGCAKSALVQEVTHLAGVRVRWLALHRETRRAELLGESILRRSVEGGSERLRECIDPVPLADAEVLVLDDLGRAPASVLGVLQPLLSGRVWPATGRALDCALATATTPHAPPQGGAFADLLERFTLRVTLRGLITSQDWEGARELLEPRAELPPPAAIWTPAQRTELQERARRLPIAAPVRRAWLERVRRLDAGYAGTRVSDRALSGGAAAVLRAHALLRGAACVELADLSALRFVFGSEAAQAAWPQAEEGDLPQERSRPAVPLPVPAAAAEQTGRGGGAARRVAVEPVVVRDAPLPAAPAGPGLGRGAPDPDLRALLDALAGPCERPRAHARGAAGVDDPGGAPRALRVLRHLGEIGDADPVEALLFAQGRLARPHALRRTRPAAPAVLVLARDVSASMEGRLGRWAAEVVGGLLERAARVRARVGYIEFNHQAVRFRDRGAFLHHDYAGLLRAGAHARAEGATSYQAPLAAALEELARAPELQRQLVLLTDGLPVVGDPEVRCERERARRAGVRIHSVFVGLGPSPALLDSLARETGGLAFQARPLPGGRIRVAARPGGPKHGEASAWTA
jgi:MoxR-like ATPase/Mg-chelatase subunit ChlD